MIGVLHIGAEKSGTTTLQDGFTLNRDLLRTAGVLYPRTPGTRQHSLLAFYAMDDDKEPPAHSSPGWRFDGEPRRLARRTG